MFESFFKQEIEHQSHRLSVLIDFETNVVSCQDLARLGTTKRERGNGHLCLIGS